MRAAQPGAWRRDDKEQILDAIARRRRHEGKPMAVGEGRGITKPPLRRRRHG